MQILRNLIGNAFKFTEEGSVTVKVAFAGPRTPFVNESLSRNPSRVLSFSVTDTGIGIPRDKRAADFRSLSPGGRHDQPKVRRGPGSGSPSAVSSRACSAERSASRASQGEARASRSTCPSTSCPRGTSRAPPPSGFGLGPAPVLDDRGEISPYDRVLLIVESDLEVAQALLGAGRRHGFKGVVATSGVGPRRRGEAAQARRDRARPAPAEPERPGDPRSAEEAARDRSNLDPCALRRKPALRRARGSARRPTSKSRSAPSS